VNALGAAPVAASGSRAFAVGAALVLAFALTCLVSREPLIAFHALLTGALPQIGWSEEHGWVVRRLTRFGAVIEDAITLTLLGLAMLIGLRARQFSMGADGQFFLGALAAAWVGAHAGMLGAAVLPLAVAAAVGTGFAWGAVPGVLKARWGANEIVTTLMLNAVAIQLYRLIVTHAFNDPGAGYVATPLLGGEVAPMPLVARTNVTAFVIVAPMAALAAWALLARTTLGYEIRAVGDAPAFARHAGMPVGRVVALSMAIGGAFAGLAGAHVATALLKRLPVDLAPGVGFEGLVVALLARNDPKAVPLAALLYAYLKGGAQAMERASDVPREMVLVVQACVVLLMACHWAWPRWRRWSVR
jgi:ABC-type uncharacterized transport system permease subunit